MRKSLFEIVVQLLYECIIREFSIRYELSKIIVNLLRLGNTPRQVFFMRETGVKAICKTGKMQLVTKAEIGKAGFDIPVDRIQSASHVQRNRLLLH